MNPTFAVTMVASASIMMAAPVHPRIQDAEKDLPSISREALKSVVEIETKDQEGQPLSQGSGFVVSNDGKIVTNYHVIQGAAFAVALFPDGASYQVQGLVASNPNRDLVLLQIQTTSKDFRFLSLADSDKVEAGEQVVALGSPLGLQATVSPGFISGVRETDGLKLLQTTAPISPGNSGGALINLTGKVVGVPTLSLTSVRQNATVSQNLNFAIPSNYVGELLKSDTGEVSSLSSAVPHTQLNPPSRSPKEIITSAKTLCVTVPSGNEVLKTELSGKLLEWGRLRLVSSPDDADLVLEVTQTGELNLETGAGNQATAMLVDGATGVELWAKTRGGSWAMSGYSIAWVARQLAKDFIKFYEGSKKQSQK